MLFGKCKSNVVVQIKINNVLIERVKECRFLGVILSQNMSWKPQINSIRCKVAKNIAIMGRCRYLFDQQTLFILYCSLILPYFNYCSEVWGNTYNTHLQILYRLQKKAIRVVHNVGHSDHTNGLFLKSNTLKLVDLIKLKSLLMIYKAKKNQLPRNIQQLFANRDDKYNLRGTQNLKVQRTRTTLKGQCISRRGVNLWNHLDADLKEATSLQQFKRHKRSVLERYASDMY